MSVSRETNKHDLCQIFRQKITTKLRALFVLVTDLHLKNIHSLWPFWICKQTFCFLLSRGHMSDHFLTDWTDFKEQMLTQNLLPSSLFLSFSLALTLSLSIYFLLSLSFFKTDIILNSVTNAVNNVPPLIYFSVFNFKRLTSKLGFLEIHHTLLYYWIAE